MIRKTDLEKGWGIGSSKKFAVAAHQTAFDPALELAFFDLLWSCMDDHKRLELCAVRAGNPHGKCMDAGSIRSIPRLFVVADLAWKSGHLCHCVDIGSSSVSKAPKGFIGTGKGNLPLGQIQKGKKAEKRHNGNTRRYKLFRASRKKGMTFRWVVLFSFIGSLLNRWFCRSRQCRYNNPKQDGSGNSRGKCGVEKLLWQTSPRWYGRRIQRILTGINVIDLSRLSHSKRREEQEERDHTKQKDFIAFRCCGRTYIFLLCFKLQCLCKRIYLCCNLHPTSTGCYFKRLFRG